MTGEKKFSTTCRKIPGMLMKADEFNCNQRSYNISTSSFTPGIYFVGVSFNGEKPEFNKLVIVR